MKAYFAFLLVFVAATCLGEARGQTAGYGPLVVRNDSGHPVTFWVRKLKVPTGERFIMDDKLEKTVLEPGEERRIALSWPNKKSTDGNVARHVAFEYEIGDKRFSEVVHRLDGSGRLYAVLPPFQFADESMLRPGSKQIVKPAAAEIWVENRTYQTVEVEVRHYQTGVVIQTGARRQTFSPGASGLLLEEGKPVKTTTLDYALRVNGGVKLRRLETGAGGGKATLRIEPWHIGVPTAVSAVEMQAIEAGIARRDPLAMVAMGWVECEGLGRQKNASAGARWFSAAAEAGYGAGDTALGWLMEHGLLAGGSGGAAAYYESGAQKKYPTAQLNLGVHLVSAGRQAEAVKWFQAAKQQGDARAGHQLALMQFSGAGMPRVIGDALKELGEAAKFGDMESQYLLGSLYLEGQHLPRDPAKAREWLALAQEQGHPLAGDSLAAAGMAGLASDVIGGSGRSVGGILMRLYKIGGGASGLQKQPHAHAPCPFCQGRGRKEVPFAAGGVGEVECSACGGSGKQGSSGF